MLAYFIGFLMPTVPQLNVSAQAEGLSEDCMTAMLARYHMVPTNEAPAGCELFMTVTLVEGRSYYSLHSHCADMIPYSFDCQGVIWLFSDMSAEHPWYGLDVTFPQVVGVRRCTE